MNSLSQFLFLRCALLLMALCSSVLCRPLVAQTSQRETPSSDASSSTSVSPGADSSNSAEDAPAPSNRPTYGLNSCDVSQLKICIKDFLGDQAGIWTSPLRLHAQDLSLIHIFNRFAVGPQGSPSLAYSLPCQRRHSTKDWKPRAG